MVELNPDFWDSVPETDREIILRGALQSSHVQRFLAGVEYERRMPERKRDIKAEVDSETKDRIKRRWAAAEQAQMPKLRQIRPIRGA